MRDSTPLDKLIGHRIVRLHVRNDNELRFETDTGLVFMTAAEGD